MSERTAQKDAAGSPDSFSDLHVSVCQIVWFQVVCQCFLSELGKSLCLKGRDAY